MTIFILEMRFHGSPSVISASGLRKQGWTITICPKEIWLWPEEYHEVLQKGGGEGKGRAVSVTLQMDYKSGKAELTEILGKCIKSLFSEWEKKRFWYFSIYMETHVYRVYVIITNMLNIKLCIRLITFSKTTDSMNKTNRTTANYNEVKLENNGVTDETLPFLDQVFKYIKTFQCLLNARHQ